MFLHLWLGGQVDAWPRTPSPVEPSDIRVDQHEDFSDGSAAGGVRSPSFRVAALCLGLAMPMLAFAASPASGHKWVATWAQSMTSNVQSISASSDVKGSKDRKRTPTLHDATLRQVVLTSVGGERVRIRLSNYYGQHPLTIDHASIALGTGARGGGSAIDTSSVHRLTFDGGKAAVTIGAGEMATSDPVKIRVAPLSKLDVSLYFSGAAALADVHPMENVRTAWAVAGNQVDAAGLKELTSLLPPGKHPGGHVYILDGVDVFVPSATRGIVAFGDSITDGAYATTLGSPWPEVLASIANVAPAGTGAGVVNAGISADELTTDQIGSPGAGASGLKRFERDVIDQPGVTDVIVLFGANDLSRGIGLAGKPTGASANDLIAGFRMLVDVAHAHHLRIDAGTIMPFAGFPAAGWYSPQKEATRVAVNHWIRGSGAFDGVIDFSDAVRGAYRPSPLAAQQKTPPPGMATVCAGDAGLHPNDLGYAVMGTQAYNALFHATLQPAQRCH